MSICFGIIAEYNPLHNGHRLMMKAVREVLGDVPCVVVLSSNFTQRGEPALCNKWTRAEMALRCGADLVIELPFMFSCAAAPDFAAGAVGLLARTGLVSHIAFGMENPGTDVSPMLDILINEPPKFRQRLHCELKRGASYSKAMAMALEDLIPGGSTFVSSPNNLLAISYMLNIRKHGYDVSPLPLPRIGSGHGGSAIGPLASAGAIRSAVNNGASIDDESRLSIAMPASTLSLLRGESDAGRLCLPFNAENKILWPLLRALLLRSSPEELRSVDGIDEGIENLFIRHWKNAVSFSDFLGRCVSARYTHGHIRRRVISLLLGINRWDAMAARRTGAPYARVLGYTARGRELIKKHKKNSEIPFITRLAKAEGPAGRMAAQIEFRASALHEMLLPRPDMRREERMKPVR